MKLLSFVIAAATLGVFPALAFIPPTDTAGALTIGIADPGEVKEPGKPIAVPVTLTHAGDAPVSGSVGVTVTDD